MYQFASQTIMQIGSKKNLSVEEEKKNYSKIILLTE